MKAFLRSIFLLSIIILVNNPYAKAQGCSDAGFCTMGAMRPDQAYDKENPLRFRYADVSYYLGETRVSASIQAVILDVGFDVFKDYNVHIKVPYMMVDGNFGSTRGVGDLSFSVSRNLARFRNFDFNATVGAKIPTGNADLKHETQDVVLPMYYQITLGTYDLVMGGAFINDQWLFSFGYQQPLIHVNENTFGAGALAWDFYPGGQEYVERHAVARNLRRGADVMLRLERNFRFSRFNANIGILPIYRITNDQIMDTEGNYFKPEGARGLATSLLTGCGYQFNVKTAVKLIYGVRIVDRAKNPDGLSRESVLNVSFKYNF